MAFAPTRGTLIPIGGKLSSDEILERFIGLCGGADARIAVIPTASNEPGMGAWFARAFEKLGVARARSIEFRERSDCDDADWLEELAFATGFFITGGDQLKLASILGGTPAHHLMRERFHQGVSVAGTSAGAAILSRHMIARGDEGASPRMGMVTLAGGFGFLDGVIVDQHFRERDRLGRLLTAVALIPECLGLGVDENTAAIISPDGTVDVMGAGAVTIVDASRMGLNTIHQAAPGQAITMSDVRVHLLAPGATYHLATRTAHLARTLVLDD
ncbi:MAG: cyanophycinase [Gemmatimonadetes bacterium]|nr:cyanophycinase [Gemmatimonadota bacterium]